MKKIITTLALAFLVVCGYAQEELVVNGTFEDVIGDSAPFYPTNWTLDQGENETGYAVNVTSNGIGGSYGLKLNIASNEYNSSATQEITVEADILYEVSFYAWYSGTLTNGASSYIQILDADADSVITKFDIPTSSIRTGNDNVDAADDIFHTFQFTATCSTVKLVIASGGIDKLIRLDNISMMQVVDEEETEGDTEEPVVNLDEEEDAESNLVTNGTFGQLLNSESPFVPTGWDLAYDEADGENAVTVEEYGIGGSYCLKLNVWDGEYDCSASQNIVVEEGATYTFSCYAWYAATPTNNMNAYVFIKNASSDKVLKYTTFPHSSVKSTSEEISVDDKTIYHTFNFTISEGCTEITLQLWSGTVDKAFRVDNVRIEKVITEEDTDVEDSDESGIVENATSNKPQYYVSNQSLQFDKEVTVAIFDLTGKQVLDETAISISVESLSTGVYILRATDVVGNTVVNKFVK